eukprot:TRINITY_DN2247_c0_g1_i10.p1 TRINITY_DN2247_c0_g1~~TRINITY_DN2247_c0_g1_i10.p1  ORF type:complete len:313 (+),score=62.46 TRINITY_DN2247_c0_g1_i10:232-1170(+)
MSVLYSSTSPFSPDVVQNYKNIIESNVVTGMCDIVTNLERFEHEVRVLVVLSSIDLQVKEENRKHVRYFLELQPNTPLSSCSNKIASLWEDPSITQTWRDMSNQEVLVPHYSYFVEKLDQIVQPDYVPTNEDIMKCRQRTSGVSLTEFMKDKYKWQLLDAGGQKPERDKWSTIIQNENILGILFFISLGDFNIKSNDEDGTKLEVAIRCFRDTFLDPNAKSLPMVLIMNKVDLFKEKIFQFKGQFPNFKGELEIKPMLNFIADLFLNAIPETVDRSAVSWLETCSLDSSLMDNVFYEIKNHVLNQAMAGLRM